ncbi:MAG: hypothetical protein ACYC0D_08235 [Candidatus Humimicrobiaceae bacterium]
MTLECINFGRIFFVVEKVVYGTNSTLSEKKCVKISVKDILSEEKVTID